jgi:hypothetical protein
VGVAPIVVTTIVVFMAPFEILYAGSFGGPGGAGFWS